GELRMLDASILIQVAVVFGQVAGSCISTAAWDEDVGGGWGRRLDQIEVHRGVRDTSLVGDAELGDRVDAADVCARWDLGVGGSGQRWVTEVDGAAESRRRRDVERDSDVGVTAGSRIAEGDGRAELRVESAGECQLARREQRHR